MPNKTTYEDIQITDKPNLDSSIIAASAGAVKDVYDKAQNSISNLYISGTNLTYTKNDGSVDNVLSAMSAEEATVGTETTPRIITAKVLNDKITSRLDVVTVNTIAELKNKGNGWYSISSANLSGITSKWIIQKFGNSSVGYLYTATNMNDPRVVLNSVDTTNWYSPYAYWHA